MESSEPATATAERNPPSHKVITEIANREDVSPAELPPLYETLDPTALDQLFNHTTNAMRMNGSVDFPYYGYEVTVHADGFLEITDLDE